MKATPPGPCKRAPLCEQALATNRELRGKVAELGARLERRGQRPIQVRVAELEAQLAERDASPWVYLPWRGYVS